MCLKITKIFLANQPFQRPKPQGSSAIGSLVWLQSGRSPEEMFRGRGLCALYMVRLEVAGVLSIGVNLQHRQLFVESCSPHFGDVWRKILVYFSLVCFPCVCAGCTRPTASQINISFCDNLFKGVKAAAWFSHRTLLATSRLHLHVLPMFTWRFTFTAVVRRILKRQNVLAHLWTSTGKTKITDEGAPQVVKLWSRAVWTTPSAQSFCDPLVRFLIWTFCRRKWLKKLAGATETQQPWGNTPRSNEMELSVRTSAGHRRSDVAVGLKAEGRCFASRLFFINMRRT